MLKLIIVNICLLFFNYFASSQTKLSLQEAIELTQKYSIQSRFNKNNYEIANQNFSVTAGAIVSSD